jgi:hypothetical protein
MEKILKIEELNDFKYEAEDTWSSSYDGFKITTDAQEILILVSNGQSCCESFGHVVSEDDFKDFIGADLFSVKVVDVGINEKMVEAGQSLDAGEIMFVNLETSNSTLQFAVYNSHNGYYGHTGIVKSTQISQVVGL